MLEQAILGVVQGFAEWLPISSEGIIVLIMNSFFEGNVSQFIKNALLLHLGTVLAAIIYFRKDLINVIKLKDKVILRYLIVTTLTSGIVGLILFKVIENAEDFLLLSGKAFNIFIAMLLVITGIFLFKVKDNGLRKIKDINIIDEILLGILQGLAILPGFSRSGLTISGLLLRKFDDQDALKLSFLMSIPAIILGNIFLGLEGFVFYPELLIGLFLSFLIGILTIDILLKFSRKVNFGKFVLTMAIIILIYTISIP